MELCSCQEGNENEKHHRHRRLDRDPDWNRRFLGPGGKHRNCEDMVVDSTIPDAPVYIYGEQKTKFTGGKDVPGTTTLSMQAGNYRNSSAIMKKTGDYFDRFASNEAHVEVILGDNTVVVLTLKPLEDALSSIGYSDLHKMGLGSDIACNLN